MHFLIEIVVANILVASVLAVLALGASRTKRWPAIAHLLWVLVLIKLVSPPLFFAPVEFSWANNKTVTQTPSNISYGPSFGAETHSPAITETKVTAWLNQANGMKLFGLIWSLGSALCVAVLIVRILHFKSTLKRTRRGDRSLLRLVSELSSQIGLPKSPEVRITSVRLSPLVCVTPRRKIILLPKRLVDKISKPSLETLLLHELAHIRRRDHWIRLIETIATVLLWWNPLVWIARRQIRVAEEMCCDAWVVSLLPDATATYARTLIETVNFLSVSKSPKFTFASGIGPVTFMRKRIVMIMQGSTNRNTPLLSRVLLAALAIILIPLVPSLAQDSQKYDEKSEVDVAKTQEDSKNSKVNCCTTCCGEKCLAACLSQCKLDDCDWNCVSCKMEKGADGILRCVMQMKDGTSKTIPMCNIADGSCFKVIKSKSFAFEKGSADYVPSPSDVRSTKNGDLKVQIKELERKLKQLQKNLEDK